MWSILSNLKKSVVLAPVAIILMLAMGCGTAEPAPAAVPASEIASMVREAVQESVPAPAEAGPSAAEIQQLIEAAVSNAPAGVTAAEVQRLVQGAISAAVANAPTGVTAAEIQQAVENSVRQAAAGQLTAAEVQGIVDASIRSLPAPQVDTGQLRGLVQAAVQESVPKGTSAEEIRRMVEAAVTATTAGAVTRGDMEALITKSVIDVAAGQLSTSDVEKIVAASLSATERAIEATEKAVAEAGMAAMAAQAAAEKAVEEAQMAAAAAMPAPVAMATTPAGCFIKGDKVSDCPLRSPHTWQAPLVAPGEFPSYANYQGPRPTKFYESPMSYQLVKQGKLPPIEERLPHPEDIKVLQPVDEIGEYGGTYRSGYVAVRLSEGTLGNWYERDANGTDWYPWIGKSAEVSADGRVYTLKLRRGLKYSDGTPFTMEDIRFAWEDVNFNKELNPNVNPEYRDPITRNPVKFAVVDDHTWTLSFDSPKYTLFELRSGKRGWSCRGGNFCYWLHPEKKQYHEKYADPDALQKEIDAAKVDDWVKLWDKKNLWRANPGLACARQWCISAYTDQQGTASRNHYFFAVDPEGNQLPYQDEYTMFVWGEEESRAVPVIRALAGEEDGFSPYFIMQEMPLYMSHMQQGDFSLYRWPSTGGSDAPLNFNQTWNNDKEIGKWIRTKEFRQALSLAIDAGGINNAVFLGVGTVQNWVPHPSTPFYPGPEYARLHTRYDPAMANQILDSLGLDKKDAQGFRLRTDGSGERLVLQSVIQDNESVSVEELIKGNLADVGIELKFRVTSAAGALHRNNEEYIGTFIDYSAYQANPWMAEWGSLVCLRASCKVGTEIGRWHETKGEQGMAPTGPDPNWLPLAPEGTFPADPSGNMKRLMELEQQGLAYTRLHPRRIEIGKELFRINTEELYTISTVGFTGSRRGVYLNRNNVRNQPRTHIRDQHGFVATATYYFEDGMDNLHHPGNRSKRYKSWSFLGGEY